MPPRSRSDVSFTKTTLSYPIFAAEFDPYNRGYLVVAGGGGESRTGVPNKITVLDVSNRAVITPTTELELSREEDSVQSVANLATKDGLIVLAGINSSEKNQAAGKNEHFRSFGVKYPPRKKQRTEETKEQDVKSEWKTLGKRSLLRPGKETYQRILRLSQPHKTQNGSKRVGAIASGSAKDSEVIIFNATNPTPDASDILTRIDLPENLEANDLDITESETSEFSVAYCADYDIYEQTLRYDFAEKDPKKRTEKRPNGPRRVHQLPFPDVFNNPTRPKFRCVRFLNAQNIITVCNNPNKGGAEFRMFHLYPTGPAMEIQAKPLPGRIKQAINLDVCALDLDKSGNQQFVVAVAGQDSSIEVFTLDYQRQTDTFTRLKSYLTIRDAHPQGITGLCFSHFHTPATADKAAKSPTESKTTQAQKDPGPQYIQLASVSFGNTVVVDTFPVAPLNPGDFTSRYVLSNPNTEAFMKWAYVLIFSLVVLIFAFMVQSFRTGFEDDVGPFQYLPKNVRNFLDQPAAAAYGAKMSKVTDSVTSVANSVPSGIPTTQGRLAALVDRHLSTSEEGQTEEKKAVIVRPPPGESAEEAGSSGLTFDIHPDKEAYRAKNEDAKHWHELSAQQQQRWKDRLVRAGEWVEGEGEKVFLGVLFSEFAGLVGEGVGEMLRG